MLERKNRIWSKNGLIWIAFVLIIAGSLVVYSTYFQRLGHPPEQRIKEIERMECWIYSSEWEPILKSLQARYHEVEMNVRTFQSYEALHSELSAAISAGRAPQIAELNNAYGLAEWAEDGALEPIKLPGETTGLTVSARNAFTFQGKLWAMPAGASIPVLYYNQDKLRNASFQRELEFADLEQLNEEISGWVRGLNHRNASIKWKQVMAVDENLAFVFLNMWGHPAEEERRERLLKLLGAWNRLVFDSGVMFPLEHRLALSEFMDGQILLLVSSSQHMQWMDKYIAGKFNYGAVPLPGAADRGVSPGFSAFAVLAGGGNRELAQELVNHIASPYIQDTLLDATGYMPVRQDSLDSLAWQTAEGTPYHMLLRLVGKDYGIAPMSDDYRRWNRIDETLKALEIERRPDLERKAADLLPLLP
ncbi:extracellular solute-binding protein [Paenibacillus lautus]|uniref:extracellular solute-binding protein n=1 Tax=Paenibacillus lautus TaxID=1401 RepID=UPI003D281F72